MALRSVRLQPGPVLAPTPVRQPMPHVITTTPLAHNTPQGASSFESQLLNSPAAGSDFNRPPANPVEYQPAYSYSQPIMEQLNTAPTSQGAPPLFSAHHGHQTAPIFSAPYPGYAPLPGAELLLATALGIPRPSLLMFESGQDSDFALLKLALDTSSSQVHCSLPSRTCMTWHHIQCPAGSAR